MPTASRHLFRRHQAQLWQRGQGSSPQTPPLAPTSTRPRRVSARPWLKTKTKTEQRGSCRQPTPRSPRPGSPLTTFLPFNPAVTRNGQATLSLSQPPPLCLQEQTVLAWDVPTRQDVSSGTPSLCVHRAGSKGQGQRQDRAQVLRPGPRTLCCSRGDPGAHDDLAGGPGAASGDAPSFLLVPQPNPWAWGERETVPLVLGSVLVQEDTRQPWQDPTPLCPCSAVSARGGISGIQQARPRWSSAPQTNLAPANTTPGGSSRLQRHAFHSCTPIPRSPRNVPPQDSRLLKS